MKYLSLVLLLFTVGCSLPFTVARPQQPAYGPDTLLTVISNLQDTAILKEKNQEIPTSSARLVIQFTVDAAKLVKASNTNVAWKQMIGASLTQLQRDLPVLDAGKFSATFDLIRKITEAR